MKSPSMMSSPSQEILRKRIGQLIYGQRTNRPKTLELLQRPKARSEPRPLAGTRAHRYSRETPAHPARRGSVLPANSKASATRCAYLKGCSMTRWPYPATFDIARRQSVESGFGRKRPCWKSWDGCEDYSLFLNKEY